MLQVLITQSCPTLCDPIDCNPPGSFIHGILQARILEWVAIPFPTQGLNPALLYYEQILYSLSHQYLMLKPSGYNSEQEAGNWYFVIIFCFSVARSSPTFLLPQVLQHDRLPYPLLSPGVCSNSCSLSQ